MKRHILTLLLTALFLPALSIAQTVPLDALTGDNGQRFCRDNWSGPVVDDQRRYQACVLEQSQARSRIQSIHGRFASQGFYRDIALPYCRSAQNSNMGRNLVEISFCLEDELAGYQVIQDLRRRYGGNRVDAEISEAIAAVGSWAAAANQVKRNTGLKIIR